MTTFQFPDMDRHTSMLRGSIALICWSSNSSQCMGILRNQNRALKSSEHVRNAGAVGEWTISLTGPLCPATNCHYSYTAENTYLITCLL